MRFERSGLGIAQGMALTLKHLFRSPITTQYPEERLVNSRRHRGPELIWVSQKCTGCATCAKACPQGNIEIITSTQTEENTWKVEKYEVDHGRCMFCGLCVEACPFDALYMGRGYERASYYRHLLVLPKEQLQMAPDRQPSGWYRSEVEAELPPQTLLIYGQKRGVKG